MISENWKKIFPKHILDRGRDYAYSGAIENIQIESDTIKAVVRGSEYYRVEIILKSGLPQDMYCSCPYADGGNHCKHMAAVLFEAEDEGNYSLNEGLPRQQPASDIEELLYGLKKEDLIAFVKNLADENSDIANLLRVRFSNSISTADMRELKREADRIFRSHENRGFIDYREAFEFEIDICRFLSEKVGQLADNGQFMEAFELSMYIYVKLSNTDIDDDGEIQTISSECYDIWKRIISYCSEGERERIKSWFDEHADDGTVVDYMEDVLQEFRDRELASDDDLRSQMRELDMQINAAGNSTQCPTVWSFTFYNKPAVFARIELMKRLGIDDHEIDAYRNAHRHFTVIREQYIKEAEEANDRKMLISLLEESKALDAKDVYKIHSYSQRLADLYHETDEIQKEFEERLADFLHYPGRNLEDFRAVKGLCVKEKWPVYRDQMIAATEDPDKRFELFAEEKMLDLLYRQIFDKPDLKYIDKYGFLLADNHSEEILEFYEGYVQSTAEYVRNRAGYDLLTGYLSRMQHYKGGTELVRKLAAKWIEEYPTRKVMVQELRRFL